MVDLGRLASGPDGDLVARLSGTPSERVRGARSFGASWSWVAGARGVVRMAPEQVRAKQAAASAVRPLSRVRQGRVAIQVLDGVTGQGDDRQRRAAVPVSAGTFLRGSPCWS